MNRDIPGFYYGKLSEICLCFANAVHIIQVTVSMNPYFLQLTCWFQTPRRRSILRSKPIMSPHREHSILKIPWRGSEMTKRFGSQSAHKETREIELILNRNNINAPSGPSGWLKRLFEKRDSWIIHWLGTRGKLDPVFFHSISNKRSRLASMSANCIAKSCINLSLGPTIRFSTCCEIPGLEFL